MQRQINAVRIAAAAAAVSAKLSDLRGNRGIYQLAHDHPANLANCNRYMHICPAPTRITTTANTNRITKSNPFYLLIFFFLKVIIDTLPPFSIISCVRDLKFGM